MADRPDVASYKLAADTGDFVGPMKAAAGASDELAAAVAKSDVAIEKRGKTVRFSTDYFERQERKLSDAARIEYQYAKAIADADKARAAGIGTEQAYSNVVDLLNEKRKRAIDGLAVQDAAMKKSATTTGLARYELINLSRQFQDIGVSLAGGQSPLRIIIEQGSQILDVFASSKAAFGQVFSSMIAWAARAATSIVGIATAVAALGLAAGALAISWVEGQRQIERSLIGVGARSGLAVKDVNRIAESASQSTRLSISAAREAAIEFIKTGEIYGENVERAVNLTDKFALATGTSAATAAKTLAESLSDPIKGAQELNKEFGFLDGKALQLIRTLVATGREQEAQRVLMEKASPAIKEAANAASGWAKIWMDATQALSIYVTELQKLVTFQEKVRALTGPIQPAAGAGRFGAARAAEQRPARDPAEALGLSAMDKQLESLRNKWSLLADNAIRSIFAQIPAIETLKKQLTDLERAQNDAAVAGKMGFAQQLQPAIDAARLKLKMEEDSLAVQQRQTAAVRQVAEAYKGVSVETALTLNNLEKQIAIYTARNQRGIEAAVNEQKINELMLQGKSAAEAQLIISKQQQLTHLQNMTTLKEGLHVAEARTGIAKINAQYENDINQRLREGATLSQAIAEASIKRKIAIENVNTAITEQIHGLNQQIELIQARRSGDEASVIAAQAYENAIRQGADAAHAAALEAKVLELEMEKVADAAARAAQGFAEMGRQLRQNNTVAATANQLAAKLASIGTGGVGFSVGETAFTNIRTGFGAGPGGPLVGAAGMGTPLTKDLYMQQLALQLDQKQLELQQKNLDAILDLQKSQTPGTAEFEAAAKLQMEAAQAQLEAAKQQQEAAKAARAAMISALDEAVADIVATKLLAGQSAAAVNLLIEQGGIPFGTASARFQTQLDLYKRAGASNSQIAADIRAGIIGEGAKPSELLEALDSLTDAVNSNTDAQLGLSPFYTSQGDRQLGYRGYTVQKGASNIPGTGVGGIGTAGGSMIGGGEAISGGGIQTGGGIAVDQTPIGTAPNGTVLYARIINGMIVYGYYGDNGQWIQTAVVGRAPGISMPRDTPGLGVPVTQGAPIGSTAFAEGGIANQPTFGMFGEAGPEAFVPLKGGAIPVRFAANQNRPNVVNINAPLVNFMAEPTRDEVRQSAFQAAQLLRRVAAG